MSSLPEKWKEAIHKVLNNWGYGVSSLPEITAALTQLWEEQQAQAQREMGTVLTILFGKLRGAAWNAVHEDYPEVAEKVARHDAELRKRVRNQALTYAAGVCIPTEIDDTDCNIGCHDADAAAIFALLDKPESTVREGK